ncbi:hypothetical protein [Pectobacterium carotovorum]|uniref:hypothetical protein n=1 Tax=Pectobacterium carotovorum TaxID=554 RepID=UPI0015DD7DDE|nr:hypothetical protein [Pectobacterium carotovorum]MBA0176395.1 hypothetical protein [Pectobacterium carotovorum]
MDNNLLRKYREYARTEEAYAVFFVKQHLVQSKGHWIDISDSQRYEMSSDNLHFKFVSGGLYRRKIHPQYPPKSSYTVNGWFDERNYYLMVSAITWETAHRDIEQQKLKRERPLEFEITGVSYDKNKGRKGYFQDDAPEEIKALADNLSDRTNPLWDRAIAYINEPEFVYEVRRVRLLNLPKS